MIYLMSKKEQMVDAIIKDPTDLTMRMVYADWLDENAEPLSESNLTDSLTVCGEKVPRFLSQQWVDLANFIRFQCNNQGREAEKLWLESQKTASIILAEQCERIAGQGFYARGYPADSWDMNNGARYKELFLYMRHGFVDEVYCTCDQWIDLWPNLGSAYPMNKLVLYDKEVSVAGTNFKVRVDAPKDVQTKFWLSDNGIDKTLEWDTVRQAQEYFSDIQLKKARKQLRIP